MTQETLKMALEALYPIAHNTTDDPRGQAYKAIVAIKAALAQPEQECPNLKNCNGACFQCEYFNVETGEMEYPVAQPEQEPSIQDQLDKALQSLDFYRRRVQATQEWQGKMRDPERTIVCDIIANGHTLEPAGDRYTPPQQEQEPCDMGAICIGCTPRNADGSCPGEKPNGACDCYQSGFDDGMNEFKEWYETEQEPVAWRTFDGEGGYDYRSYEDNESYADEWDKRNPNHKGWVDKLYTHSQPKQELTNIERHETNIEKFLGAPQQPEQMHLAYIEYIPCCTDKTCPKCKAAATPRRTWVGLTEEKIEYVWRKVETSDFHDCVLLFAKELEAELKKENT